MTTTETIEQRVKRAIAVQLGIASDDIGNSDNLADKHGVDSIDEVELMMEIEDEFEIVIPDEAGEDWKTAQDVIDYITKRGV